MKVAAIQMVSAIAREANLARAHGLLAQAASTVVHARAAPSRPRRALLGDTGISRDSKMRDGSVGAISWSGTAHRRGCPACPPHYRGRPA